jgi:hypothetical protein
MMKMVMTYGQFAWYEPLCLTCIDGRCLLSGVLMIEVGWWIAVSGVCCECKREGEKWARKVLIRKGTRVDPENQNTQALFFSALRLLQMLTSAESKSALITLAKSANQHLESSEFFESTKERERRQHLSNCNVLNDS